MSAAGKVPTHVVLQASGEEGVHDTSVERKKGLAGAQLLLNGLNQQAAVVRFRFKLFDRTLSQARELCLLRDGRNAM